MIFGKVHFEISTGSFKIIITNLTIKLSPWQVFEAFRLLIQLLSLTSWEGECVGASLFTYKYLYDCLKNKHCWCPIICHCSAVDRTNYRKQSQKQGIRLLKQSASRVAWSFIKYHGGWASLDVITHILQIKSSGERPVISVCPVSMGNHRVRLRTNEP